MLPLHHGGLPMGAMGLEPIPPVLETGCLPFGEAPADDGGRSRTGVFSLCGGAHHKLRRPNRGFSPGEGRSLGRRRPPQWAAESLLCHPVAWEERRGSNPLPQGHGLPCCRYTTFLIVETARFSGEASGENRTPILPLTGRPLGQFERRW